MPESRSNHYRKFGDKQDTNNKPTYDVFKRDSKQFPQAIEFPNPEQHPSKQTPKKQNHTRSRTKIKSKRKQNPRQTNITTITSPRMTSVGYEIGRSSSHSRGRRIQPEWRRRSREETLPREVRSSSE